MNTLTIKKLEPTQRRIKKNKYQIILELMFHDSDDHIMKRITTSSKETFLYKASVIQEWLDDVKIYSFSPNRYEEFIMKYDWLNNCLPYAYASSFTINLYEASTKTAMIVSMRCRYYNEIGSKFEITLG